LQPVIPKENTQPSTVSNNKKLVMITLSHHNTKNIMIQVNQLSKKYNGTTVLNIEHLEIPKGQSLGLVEITVQENNLLVYYWI
jgi:hypothetical protein